MRRSIGQRGAGPASWVASRVPAAWFVEPPEVIGDDLEILVVGRIPPPDGTEGDGSQVDACAAAIAQFRRATRQQRSRISAAAAARFGRRLSWGARCGELLTLFTGLSAPVMTRLRLPERALLDTLVEGGVARSRSDALAWCARLVAANQSDWVGELRAVVEQVRRVRAAGPRP